MKTKYKKNNKQNFEVTSLKFYAEVKRLSSENGITLGRIAMRLGITYSHFNLLCSGRQKMSNYYLEELRDIFGEKFNILRWQVFFGIFPVDFYRLCQEKPNKVIDYIAQILDLEYGKKKQDDSKNNIADL